MSTAILAAAKTQAIYPTEDWNLVFSATITGLLVVFLILMILIVMIWLLGKTIALGNSAQQKREQKKLAANSVSAPVAKPQTAAVPQPKSVKPVAKHNEVVAAITAAIHMIGTSEGKQYQITKIKKSDRKTRSGWGASGVRESMNSDFLK